MAVKWAWIKWKLLLIIFGFGNVAENVRECIRDDAFGLRWRWIARHRICFAGARLAIGQYGAIVTFEYFVNDWTSCVYV